MAPKVTTPYVILYRTDQKEGWHDLLDDDGELVVFNTRGADMAMRTALLQSGTIKKLATEVGVDLLVVPLRSFSPKRAELVPQDPIVKILPQ